ncbi:hypothetical protein KKG52_00735 [Patescibacteria group bacterium]|nr:hypothetical protein [Patescibacteria group bacterium]
MPRISGSEEIDKIKRLAEGKTVVVFNDHTESGRTIGMGYGYVRGVILKGSNSHVIPLTNDPIAQRIYKM